MRVSGNLGPAVSAALLISASIGRQFASTKFQLPIGAYDPQPLVNGSNAGSKAAVDVRSPTTIVPQGVV